MALDPALASIVVIQWWSTLIGAKCAFHTSFQKYQQRGSFRHRIYEGQFMPGKIARGDSSFWPISSLLKSRETTDWLSFRCLPSFLFSATTATFTLERFYSHKVRKYLSSLQLRKSRRSGSLPRLQSEGRWGKIESSTQGKESHQHDCQE